MEFSGITDMEASLVLCTDQVETKAHAVASEAMDRRLKSKKRSLEDERKLAEFYVLVCNAQRSLGGAKAVLKPCYEQILKRYKRTLPRDEEQESEAEAEDDVPPPRNPTVVKNRPYVLARDRSLSCQNVNCAGHLLIDTYAELVVDPETSGRTFRCNMCSIKSHCHDHASFSDGKFATVQRFDWFPNEPMPTCDICVSRIVAQRINEQLEEEMSKL